MLFFSFLIQLSISLTLEERKEILIKELHKKVKESNPPSGMEGVIMHVFQKSTVLFYTFKNSDIKKLKNKFDLSDEIANDIRVAPILQDGGSIGFVSDEKKMMVDENSLSGGYRDYQKTVGTVFKEGDHSFLALIRIKLEFSLVVKNKKTEYKECHTTFFFFKSCDIKIKVEIQRYTTKELETLNLAAQYYASKVIKGEIPKLSDKNIQAYFSQGNLIYSDDKETAMYVGEFGDCAVGPVYAINSVIDPGRLLEPRFEGEISYGKFISYCYFNRATEPKRKEECEDSYNGMDVYKLNMIFGRVKPDSSYLDHRIQMKNNEKDSPYSLIVYNNGEIEFRSDKRGAVFRSNTKGKGVPPYSINISNNNEFIVTDFKGTVIYKSKYRRKIPTVEIKIEADNYQYRYVNGYAMGNYFKEINKFSLELRDYPGLKIRYEPLILEENLKSCSELKYNYNYQNGQTVKGHLLALKAKLEGRDDEYYKLCYSIYVVDINDRFKGRWTGRSCDFQSTSTIHFECYPTLKVFEKITSLIVYITYKD